MKLYLVFKTGGARVVSNGVIFHVVLNISVVSVSDKTILHALFKIIIVSVMKLCVIWYWKSVYLA